jgi:hypothetical protein
MAWVLTTANAADGISMLRSFILMSFLTQFIHLFLGRSLLGCPSFILITLRYMTFIPPHNVPKVAYFLISSVTFKLLLILYILCVVVSLQLLSSTTFNIMWYFDKLLHPTLIPLSGVGTTCFYYAVIKIQQIF